MPFKDNRQFIEALKKTRDIVCIKREVDWDLEAGAISRRAMELSGPATLFEKIKGYREGYRLFGGILATYRRVAVALGLPADTPIKEIYRVYESRQEKPVKPVVVKTGPCKENIMRGADVDLYRLPAPMVHAGDGGRYLGTWGFAVTKDPDSDWVNWGMYRFMMLNKNTISGAPAPASHLAMVFKEKYLPQNKPMPMALVIGADPISSLAGSGGYKIGESEVDFAGALAQEPIELVKCETSDLLVPAHAEVIIEGEILPDKLAPEGPFGEYPGYRSGTMCEGVAVKVKAITYRSHPIVTMIALGTPPDDASIAASLTAAVSMKKGLLRRGVPVTEVYVPPEGVTHLIIVGVKKGGIEVARNVLDYFTARRVMTNKHIVVDEDVDVFNMAEVLHAFATKCHPGRGIAYEWYEGRANSLTPFYSPAERKRLKGVSVVFDSTWPPEWPKDIVPIKASFRTIYSQEVQERVIKNWEKYGLK